MALRDSFLLREELQPIAVTDLMDLDRFALKNAMTEGIKETLAKEIGVSFLSSDTGAKNAFSRFIEMALADTEQQGLSDKVIRNSFERVTQSDKLVNKLVEEVCEHPILTLRVMKISNSNKTTHSLFTRALHCPVQSTCGFICVGVRRRLLTNAQSSLLPIRESTSRKDESPTQVG